MTRIYTRIGDDGTTRLYDGSTVSKSDILLEVCGTLDEASTLLGLARSFPNDPWIDEVLRTMQRHVFAVGVEISVGGTAGNDETMPSIDYSDVEWLENAIDKACDTIEPIRSFTIPGGNRGAAALHIARAVMRRAERNIVALTAKLTVRRAVLAYVNRASDLLFVLARMTNHIAGIDEVSVGIDTNRRTRP